MFRRNLQEPPCACLLKIIPPAELQTNQECGLQVRMLLVGKALSYQNSKVLIS